jgi:hypothetical protein
MGIVPADEIRTIGASCPTALTLSRGETVISVLCVTNDVGLKGWTILPLVVDSTELQVDSVFRDRPVRPEKTDSDTAAVVRLVDGRDEQTYLLIVSNFHRNDTDLP